MVGQLPLYIKTFFLCLNLSVPHVFPLFADIIPYMMMHSVSDDCDQSKTRMRVETDFNKEKQMKAEKDAATLTTLTACRSSAEQVSTGNQQTEEPLPHFEVVKNGTSYTHTNTLSHTLNMQHLTAWSDFLFRCTENVELNTLRLKSVPSFLCWVSKYRFSKTVIVSATTCYYRHHWSVEALRSKPTKSTNSEG